MLEETRLDYALVTVVVEVWISVVSVGSCRRLLLDDELTGSYSESYSGLAGLLHVESDSFSRQDAVIRLLVTDDQSTLNAPA
jgi:hypothetical protein